MVSGRSASYVLDTHSCVFALGAPAKLGKKARSAMRTIEEGRGEAWIPAAVVAEIVLLRELGRIEIGLAHLKTSMEEAPGLRFLPPGSSSARRVRGARGDPRSIRSADRECRSRGRCEAGDPGSIAG